uniref:Uncharacterized protein n=1 Tax=Ditylenchus dipsaci TaxID=166011 RepID=A0A915DAC0_9BILA
MATINTSPAFIIFDDLEASAPILLQIIIFLINNNTTEVQTLELHKVKRVAMAMDPIFPLFFILMFVVAAKAPTLYALTLLYQHEEKPLILSCIVIDVVYLFTWIILWLFLTLKRDWSFKVVHDVREILSLQDAHRTADGNIQNKTMTELKNSLILMHKGHLFVTDDPLAKPSIMRHVLKSCVQDDIYWLRANQSPANRKIPLEECNGVSREMGHLLDSTAANSRLRRESASSPPVPLAAPPYQRLGSLPPHGSPMHPHSPIINSFGTLQRGMGKNNEMMYGVLPPTNTTTLGRTPNQNHYNQMPPEAYATTNYATIHRNSGSSRGLATGQHYGVLGSSSNIKTASPQLMRHVRGGSVTTTREVVIGGPLVGRNVANYNTQIYAASSRDDQEKISDVNGGQSIDTQNKYNYNGSTSNYQKQLQ